MTDQTHPPHAATLTAAALLCDRIRDQWPAGAARLIGGLLSLAAATRAPDAEEAAELARAGLAVVTADGARPTRAARALLAEAGLPLAVAAHEDATAAAEPVPLARVRIGAAVHVVGRCEGSGALALRDDAGWQALAARIEDGWTTIAAEIVRRAPGALENFVRTHMLGKTPASAPPGEHRFDLQGLEWEMTDTPQSVTIRFVAGGPDAGRFDDLAGRGDLRQRSIIALMRALPDLQDRVDDDLRGWASRIAAGATVEPIL